MAKTVIIYGSKLVRNKIRLALLLKTNLNYCKLCAHLSVPSCYTNNRKPQYII